MNNEYLAEELAEKKIRPTAVRLRVFGLLKQNPIALSLNDIEHELNPIDRTTLFRTLKAFEKHGIIHTVNGERGLVQYALCSVSCSCSYSDHMHVHFSCHSCRKTYCLYDIRIPGATLPEGFTPLDANVVIKGLCKPCSA